MSNYTLISWNTLHRTHEENYMLEKSEVIKKYADENVRVADQVKLIEKIANEKGNKKVIICLQEVPGDLLKALKDKFTDKYRIFDYAHNREPMRIEKHKTEEFKDVNFHKYVNPLEFLVTMISKDLTDNDTYDSTIQFKKEGKAMLAVVLKDFITINTHVPMIFDGNALIDNIYRQYIAQYLEKNELTNIVICGDFNADIQDTLKRYDEADVYDKVTCFIDYKRGESTFGTRAIDQFISFGNIKFQNHSVVDVNFASDHKLVLTNFIITNENVKLCADNKKKYADILQLFRERKSKNYTGQYVNYLSPDNVQLNLLRYVAADPQQISAMFKIYRDKINELNKNDLTYQDLVDIKGKVLPLIKDKFKDDRLFELFNVPGVSISIDKISVQPTDPKIVNLRIPKNDLINVFTIPGEDINQQPVQEPTQPVQEPTTESSGGYKPFTYIIKYPGNIDINILRFKSINDNQKKQINELCRNMINDLFDNKEDLSFDDLLEFKKIVIDTIKFKFKSDKQFELFYQKEIPVTKLRNPVVVPNINVKKSQLLSIFGDETSLTTNSDNIQKVGDACKK